jgi:hypothetical protein
LWVDGEEYSMAKAIDDVIHQPGIILVLIIGP